MRSILRELKETNPIVVVLMIIVTIAQFVMPIV